MIADNQPIEDTLFPAWATAGQQPKPSKKRKTYASPSYQSRVGQTQKNTTGYTARSAPPVSAVKAKSGVKSKPINIRGYAGKAAPKPAKPSYTKPAAQRTLSSAPAGQAAAATPGPHIPAGSTVASVYGPLFAALNAQRSNIRGQASADADKQRAWAAEIAKQLAPTATTIQQIYGAAANDDSTFAKGFSDGMQHALGQSKDQVNAILQNNGAPAGQMQGQQPITDTGDVLYGLGGYLPASTLEKQGAAFASAAAFLPNEALGRGQQAASDVMAQARKDLLGVDQQQYDLMSKQAQSKLDQEAAKAEASLKQQALDQENRQWNATYGLNVAKAQTSAQLGQARINESRAQAQARLKQSAQQAATANRFRAASIFGVDPVTGKPTLAAVKAAHAAQQTAAKMKAGGYTKAQVAKLAQTAQQAAQNAFNGYWADPSNPHQPISSGQLASQLAAYRKKHGPDATPADLGLGYFKASYQETIMNLVNSGVPLTLAQKALNRYWRQPGQHFDWEAPESGRPRRSYQQRSRKK